MPYFMVTTENRGSSDFLSFILPITQYTEKFKKLLTPSAGLVAPKSAAWLYLVINRMLGVNASAVSGADIVNSWVLFRLICEFLKLLCHALLVFPKLE